MTVVAVKFGRSEKTYDYFAPFQVVVGQKVVVETRRGGEAIVEVVEIKPESDRADKPILRVAEADDIAF